MDSDESIRVDAMRWAASEDGKLTCAHIGVVHQEYLDALRYIHKSGIVRGFILLKVLRQTIRRSVAAAMPVGPRSGAAPENSADPLVGNNAGKAKLEPVGLILSPEV